MTTFRIIGMLTWPWIVVLYVWGIGLHWTVIGLAVVYVVSFLLAAGATWGELHGRQTQD